MIQPQVRTLLQLGAATVVLFLVLVQPNHPHAMTWGALRVFPLELPFIVFTLLALGQGRASLGFRACLTGLLVLIIALKVADFVSFNALARGFNPVADVALVDAFVRLIAGTFGTMAAILIVLVALLLLAAVGWLVWWAMGIWAKRSSHRPWPAMFGIAALIMLVATTVQIGHAMGHWRSAVDPPGTAFTARVGVERLKMVQDTLSQLRTFREDVESDALANTDGLLDLIDRDVLIVFVESYGRTSHDTDFYAQMHRPTLQAYQDRLEDAGLAMRSGFLAAPTRGGQSWLSHATFSNGLWVSNQVSYGALLASGRQSLFHLGARAGLRTAAVMPQITLDWPESERMGFESVLSFDDLGYRGPAFNWVTMPDQFTLTALDRLLRGEDQAQHLLAQVVLVSSHAPWTPVPDLLAWDQVGDGSIYAPMAARGESPGSVWQDQERVREQYRFAVDYALQTVLDYAALHADDPPLILMVGDHQATEFVALDNRPDVPWHAIGPQHLVDRLASLAPDPGLLPSDAAPVIAMDRMRDALLRAFSSNLSVTPVN